MKQWLTQSGRFLLVTIGIIFLTSFTIDATDTLRGSQTALSIFSDTLTRGQCPADMVRVDTGAQTFCIDRYEASPSEGCVFREPRSSSDTAVNSTDDDCIPVSAADTLPWVQVTQPQAMQLCAKVGKRLPTAEEWYKASLGTPDTTGRCNLFAGIAKTGAIESCVSGAGAFDMVGNVWEVVDGLVVDGVFNGANLPSEGYVAEIHEAGIPVRTEAEAQVLYQNDYFWTEPKGRFVVMRGGFYGSGSDGGIYATHAKTDPNFAGPAIGFRCVRTLSS